ncbi:hypothetical protein BH11CYA1_BH11CYA1_16570 [soil metagenome]
MTIRILMFLECNQCHAPFEQRLVAAQEFPAELREEVHEMVISAEADHWECRKNATEHYCTECIDPL